MISYQNFKCENKFPLPSVFCSIFLICQFGHSVLSDSLWPHGLQHSRVPCPSPTPWTCSNSCLLSQWCHPTISSSVIPFSFCLQSFPASGSFPMIQFFISGGQNIGASASASVLPMNIQDWFPLEWTGWISLQSYFNVNIKYSVFKGAFKIWQIKGKKPVYLNQYEILVKSISTKVLSLAPSHHHSLSLCEHDHSGYLR